MANYICKQCGVGFNRSASKRGHKFCSPACYHLWQSRHPNAGSFKEGIEVWNKGLMGIHLSPSSEFKRGSLPVNHSPIGTVRLRKNKKGVIRAWVKLSEPNKWDLRAKVEWRKHFGEIPKGLLIHHIDRNPLNDKITNLMAISRAAHFNEHRAEFESKRKYGIIKSKRKS